MEGADIRTMRGVLGNATPVLLAPAVLAALVTLIGLPSVATAQESGLIGGDPAPQVRIEARRHDDARTEFALRLHDGEDSWLERILPTRRFLPVGATTGRWLVSTPVTLRVDTASPADAAMDIRVRITARLHADGRIEFGLQQRQADGRWGERLLAARRFFPAAPRVGRWLVSSPLTVTRPRPAGFSAVGGARSGETLVAASSRRTCAVRPDGRVTCWGDEGTRERLSAAALEDVLTVSIGDAPAGVFHTCALHGDGTVSCWGPGIHGELGLGDTADRFLPTKVPGITDAVAVAAGAEHTCAVHAGGRVSCWGDGSRGQLGDGEGVSSVSPRIVPGVSENAFGQLGDGTYETRLVPTPAGAFRGFSAGEVPEDPTEFLRTWIDRVVEERQAEFPSPDCETVGDEPSEEAEAIVRTALAGQVPDWYTRNISSGAELWAAIRRAPSLRIMVNLRDEFGGFCSLDWLQYPLEIDDLPPEHDNQFRDGGCQ